MNIKDGCMQNEFSNAMKQIQSVRQLRELRAKSGKCALPAIYQRKGREFDEVWREARKCQGNYLCFLYLTNRLLNTL